MSRPRSPKSHAMAIINDKGHRIEATHTGTWCSAVHFYGPPPGYRWGSGPWVGPRNVHRLAGERTGELWMRVADVAADVVRLGGGA